MNKTFLFFVMISVANIQCLDNNDVLQAPQAQQMKQAEVTTKNVQGQKITAKDCKDICCGPALWMGLGFVCIKKLLESAGN